MPIAKTDNICDDVLTPQEVSRRLNQMDHLYAAGKRLYWMGLRHDFPNASEAELQQRWQAMLDDRRREKWGSK